MASGKALPMIIMGEDEEKKKKWIFTEQAKQELAGINKPIASISIVGRYRSGKSFFMNQFDNKGSKFEISHRTDPCTKGIWMSAQDHPKDPGACLLLLDTEGLSDLDSDGDEKDVQIFALALLLSTSLILKVNGVIDNTDLKILHLASSVASRYQSKSGKKNGNVSDICPTPHLYVIISRFDLEMEGTEDQYLAKALKRRENIRVNFPERKCFCLPTPTKPPRELESDDVLMGKCREVITEILFNPQYFKVGGGSLKGQHLANLCEQYLVALNAEDLDIPSQREVWMKEGNKKEVEKCFQLYKKQMEQRLVDNKITGDKAHELSQGEAITEFLGCKFGDESNTKVYEAELKELIANERRKQELIANERRKQVKRDRLILGGKIVAGATVTVGAGAALVASGGVAAVGAFVAEAAAVVTPVAAAVLAAAAAFFKR